jgi:hypothetical protein
VVVLGTQLTFFNDDWYFLLQRPGLTADSVFAPHNGHLSAAAVLIYKGLVAVFGLGSQLPFRLVLGATMICLGVVVFLLVSERVGRVLGLAATALVVFLGPAWEDLLWSFQIGLIGSLAAGLGALLALEQETRRRDAIACLLLVASISLSDVGVPFVVAAAIAVVLRGRPAKLWIPAVPAVLFGIWFLAYGADASSNLSRANLEHLPKYVVDSAASGLASIAGLKHGGLANTPTPGYWLLIVAGVGVAVWMLRGGRPGLRVLVFIGAALTFWGLAGANYIPGRGPLASRYQLIDVVLLILIAAELFRPVALRPWQTALVVFLVLAALVSNLATLRYGFDFMRDHAANAKADLGALEIARGRAPRRFQLFDPVAHDPYLTGVTAERYFSETDAHGRPPVDSPRQLAAAAPARRWAADSVLAAAYRMFPAGARRPTSLRGCHRLAVGAGGAADVELPSGGASISNLRGSSLALAVRRFGSPSPGVSIGALASGATIRVRVVRDAVVVPWRLTARGSAALAVCPLATT